MSSDNTNQTADINTGHSEPGRYTDNVESTEPTQKQAVVHSQSQTISNTDITHYISGQLDELYANINTFVNDNLQEVEKRNNEIIELIGDLNAQLKKPGN
jgi:hypothetical protein